MKRYIYIYAYNIFWQYTALSTYNYKLKVKDFY